jgi:hypothetical protein
VTTVVRFPLLAFAFAVDRLRRLPGARFVAPFVPWVARALIAGAVVLVLLWAAEASPQRISLADLAAGKLSSFQSWIIVSGNLQDEPGSTSSLHLYRLTDPAAPNAYLVVRSRVRQVLGPTTISGRLEGGREPVPEGYLWSARLNADAQLASELPAPMVALAMLGGALLIMLARRTAYPMFVPQAPGDAAPARGGLRVVAHGTPGSNGARQHPGTLQLEEGSGTAELRLAGTRPIPVRLHSAFTSVDVGELRGLASSEAALRVRAADDDLTLGFASPRERDAAFATLVASAKPLSRARRS